MPSNGRNKLRHGQCHEGGGEERPFKRKVLCLYLGSIFHVLSENLFLGKDKWFSIFFFNKGSEQCNNVQLGSDS